MVVAFKGFGSLSGGGLVDTRLFTRKCYQRQKSFGRLPGISFLRSQMVRWLDGDESVLLFLCIVGFFSFFFWGVLCRVLEVHVR